MDLSNFQPSFGAAVQPNVRCLVGLYGSNKDDDLDEAFSAALEDAGDDLDLLHYALDTDDTDRVQFLVGSQSLKPNGSQVTLVTVFESDESHPTHLTKQSFSHPDGEIIGLTALAAQPDWFVSIYSTYSIDRPELRTSARVWRLPTVVGSVSTSPQDGGLMVKNAASDEPSNSSSSALEYVTTLPLDAYASVRKITSHPSGSCADLACVVGPMVDGPKFAKGHLSSPATSNLVLLHAPSATECGDYRVSASAQLCLPASSQMFTSFRKSNLRHLFKTINSTGGAPITSPPNATRWSSYQQASQLAVAFESGVLGWDIRTMKPCFWLEAAHWPCVRDLDYNPHRPNLLATGGDDGCMRLWDLRYLKSKSRSHANGTSKQNVPFFDSESSTEPLYSIQTHSHWIWSVRYHPTRDQLLLSAGSDSRVCLYSLASFCSDVVTEFETCPYEEEEVDEHRSAASVVDSVDYGSDTTKIKDGLIARLEQHEESVYAADWSPVDPWYFASVSYDGNLLVNQVPEAVKLNILLQSKEDEE